MTRGRKPRAIPAIKRTFYLSADVVAQVELLLTDPTRQRYNVKYGEWSKLVEAKLREWVEEQLKVEAQAEAVGKSGVNHNIIGEP